MSNPRDGGSTRNARIGRTTTLLPDEFGVAFSDAGFALPTPDCDNVRSLALWGLALVGLAATRRRSPAIRGGRNAHRLPPPTGGK